MTTTETTKKSGTNGSVQEPKKARAARGSKPMTFLSAARAMMDLRNRITGSGIDLAKVERLVQTLTELG